MPLPEQIWYGAGEVFHFLQNNLDGLKIYFFQFCIFFNFILLLQFGIQTD